ncbi:hypothetical protein ACJJH9_06900 [Microbulbifer sp. DLAB2-AF]|uniref:hypothetical protein n=1 Tax=Microbulbifer sp. DLAB2-AF TaxID=3243395 RepID=UPI0040398FE6
MEVIPGIGTDIIRFGVTETEAIALLGRPNKAYRTDEGCKRLQFNILSLELSFEPDNEDRLSWIEIHNPELSLAGKKLIGVSQNKALAYVTEFLKEQAEFEDYGSFISASYDKHWLELQFQFGRLDCVNVGVLYDDVESPIWPSS